ncbi:hypothetical protein FRC18_005277 [Serendipita sp. 400]|nr:hypothetical protein FRC18_005277 [Serendipita sp. 400]
MRMNLNVRLMWNEKAMQALLEQLRGQRGALQLLLQAHAQSQRQSLPIAEPENRYTESIFEQPMREPTTSSLDDEIVNSRAYQRAAVPSQFLIPIPSPFTPPPIIGTQEVPSRNNRHDFFARN